MTTETLERPQTISMHSAHRPTPTGFEPNFGPEDMHAIKAIAYLMNGIFAAAAVMYGTISLLAWLGPLKGPIG